VRIEDVLEHLHVALVGGEGQGREAVVVEQVEAVPALLQGEDPVDHVAAAVDHRHVQRRVAQRVEGVDEGPHGVVPLLLGLRYG
jgi:hypothetical protein